MRRFRALLGLLALLAGRAVAGEPPPAAPAPAPSAPLPTTAFFEPAQADGAQLSPNGRYVAFVRREGDTSEVVVVDLETHASTAALYSNDKNFHLDWVYWKSDQRLVAGVTYLRIVRANAKNPHSDIIAWSYGKFMIAADRDGKNNTTLFKSDKSTARKTGSNVMKPLDMLRSDPDHILALVPTDDGRPAVWRADIRTGAAEVVEKGDSDTVGWDTDRTGAIVARFEAEGRTLVIQGRAPGETHWTDIVRERDRDLRKELADFEFLGSGEKPSTLYVAVKPPDGQPGDVRTIHVYDVATHSLGPDLWPGLKYDVSSIVTSDTSNALLGVCYWVDTLQCDFKDPVVQANVRGLSTYFHHDRNLTPVSWSDDRRWWLFDVSGPDDPGSYVLYDWIHHQVTELGRKYPDLAPERLGVMRRYVVTAADGVKIPGYLTSPPGAPKGPLPLVVMPHGGPMVRDEFDFDTWAQFIASRGYLVFQPNFRGSGGYGRTWLEKGFGQWGGLMQDDIVDGVKALIASGDADPKRICMFGASYGGYAALIQGARHPELYRCVVSWAGIADLPRLLRWERDTDGAKGEIYTYDLRQIGDPGKDRDRLTRDSPITYAATYGPPVLLVHGADDTTVPVDQSREMAKALEHAGRDVKLVVVAGENHRDWDDGDMEKSLDLVADFLRAHITPAAP